MNSALFNLTYEASDILNVNWSSGVSLWSSENYY